MFTPSITSFDKKPEPIITCFGTHDICVWHQAPKWRNSLPRKMHIFQVFANPCATREDKKKPPKSTGEQNIASIFWGVWCIVQALFIKNLQQPRSNSEKKTRIQHVLCSATTNLEKSTISCSWNLLAEKTFAKWSSFLSSPSSLWWQKPNVGPDSQKAMWEAFKFSLHHISMSFPPFHPATCFVQLEDVAPTGGKWKKKASGWFCS